MGEFFHREKSLLCGSLKINETMATTKPAHKSRQTYVLTELIALFTREQVLCSVQQLSIILRISDQLIGLKFVHIDEALDEKAWQLLADRLDKK